MSSPVSFIWYELMTSDASSAQSFYTDVVGWNAAPFGQAMDGSPYIVVSAGERGVGGIMALPDSAAEMGMPPAWVGYIHSDDVDASVEKLKKAGGAVHREPSDIPDVGRFAVVADPQGAMFMLIKPSGPDQPPLSSMTTGAVGWRELYTSDWEKALDFYSSQFGWTKSTAIDMGPMGTYQLFAVGGEDNGGMMNKPAEIPTPVWGFYFTVPAIDAAIAKVKANGGSVITEPMEVPGGAWAANCIDAQGAHFGLTAAKR